MAQRSGWDGSFISPIDGLPMAGVKCSVKYLDGSDAIVYSNKTGGAVIPGDFETSSNGIFNFYANPGSYLINAVDTHIPKRFEDKNIPFDAVAGDIAGIAGDQVDGIKGKNIDFTSELANKVSSGDMKLRYHSISGQGPTTGPDYVIGAASQALPAGVYILNGNTEQATFNVGVDLIGSGYIYGHATPVDGMGVGQVNILNYIIYASGPVTVRIKGLGSGQERAYGQLFGFDA